MKNNPQTNKVLKIFFKLERWNFLQQGKYERRMSVIFEALLPMFQRKLVPLKDIVDLSEKAFTMKDFHQICKATGVSLRKTPLVSGKDGGKGKQGEYAVQRQTLQESIWIRPNLPRRLRLFVAAHEISHKILHGESMLKPISEFELASKWFGKFAKSNTKLLLAEMEADFLAAFMICKKDK